MVTKKFLFLTILLAPLYVVRFNIGPYPSTLLEVLIGLTVVVWIFEKVKNREFKLPISSFKFPITLFLLAAGISVIVSPDKRGALGAFKAYFVEPILIYLIIKDIVKSKKDWRLVFSALALSGLWVALLAVWQGLTGQFTFAPHEALQGRAHAVYNTANAVGLYLGPIVLLLLGSIRGIRGTKSVVTVGGIGVMILAIILSKSAGAMVGMVAALLLPIAYCLVPRGWRIRAVGVIGTILVMGGILFFLNISNFTPQVDEPHVRETSDTLQFRLCLWEGARDLILDKPFFGAGLSGFKELYAEKYFTCDAESLEYPHNWVLNFWTETGALGLIAFLWILWGYGKKMPSAFLAAMLYWLIHGLVDVPYFKNDLALEFWVIMGLVETFRKLPFLLSLSCSPPNLGPRF